MMEVVGYVSLNIQIGSDPPHGNKCELLNKSFTVIKELSADCIIGQDLLLKYFDGLDFINRHLLYGSKFHADYRIHLNHHHAIEVDASIEAAAADEVKLEDKTINMFTLTLAKSVSILPNCNTYANVAVIKNKKHFNRLATDDTSLNTVYMRASNVVKDQTNGAVTVADGVYDVSQIANKRTVPIQFHNTSPHAIRIRKGTVIGQLQLSSDQDLQVQFITHKQDNNEQQHTANISSITVQDDVSQEPIDHYLPLRSEADDHVDIIDTIPLHNTNINEQQLQTLVETLQQYKDCFAVDPQNTTHHVHHASNTRSILGIIRQCVLS